MIVFLLLKVYRNTHYFELFRLLFSCLCLAPALFSLPHVYGTHAREREAADDFRARVVRASEAQLQLVEGAKIRTLGWSVCGHVCGCPYGKCESVGWAKWTMYVAMISV